MVRRCILCRDDKTRLFSFPTDKERCKEWANTIGIEVAQLNTQSKVCANHFDEKDFRNETKKTLTNNACSRPNIAIPTIEYEAGNIEAHDSENSEAHDSVNSEAHDSDNASIAAHSTPIRDRVAPKRFVRCGNSPSLSSTLTICGSPDISGSRESAIFTPVQSTRLRMMDQDTTYFDRSIVASVSPSPTEDDTLKEQTCQSRSNKEAPILSICKKTSAELGAKNVKSPKRLKLELSKKYEEIKALKKKCKRLRMQKLRMQSQMSSLNQTLEELRSKDTQEAVDAIFNVIPVALRLSIERLVKKLAKKSDAPPALKSLKFQKTEIGNKYPPELREFAVTVHFYSAALYEQLREKWQKILPASSTLKAWFRVVDGKPGFTTEAFTTLARIAEIRTTPVICNVCIDKMSIKQSVEFIHGRSYGYVNFGTIETNANTQTVASHVLVFLVISLNGSWKVPIGYFPVSSISGTIRANLLKIGLELLHDANVNIYSTTFNGASTNISMCTSLGANFDYFSPNFTPWIQQPVTKSRILLFWDPPI